MSRWRANIIQLHIDSQQVYLTGAGAQGKLSVVAGDWSALNAELARFLPKRVRLQVRVADCWVRYWLLDLPVGINSIRDGQVLLQARFESLYGQSAADWLIQADWQSEGAVLACAMPHALQQALAIFAPERLMPALLEDWMHHCAVLPRTGIWCAADDSLVSIVYWQEGRMRLVRQQRTQDIDALLRFEFTRLEEDLPAARFWSGPMVPQGWQRLEAKV